MVLAMVVLMQPGIGRMFAMLFAPPAASGPPPLAATIPTGLVTDLLIVVAIIHDWRTRGQVHPVYIYGGLSILTVQLLLVPMGNSATWMHFARALQGLMG
jgi:hypothetical protein